MNLNRLFLLLLIMPVLAYCTEYKRLTDYGDTFYNLITEYVQTNSTSSSSDILNFINSSNTATVFSDAKTSGYGRYQIIFEVYQNSFNDTNKNQAIIQALHDALQKENQMNQAVFYATWSCVGWSGISLIYMVRSTYRYLKRDNPLLTFYEQNDQRWLQASMTAGAALRGNPFGGGNPYGSGQPNS
jgi:hypothetical protein